MLIPKQVEDLTVAAPDAPSWIRNKAAFVCDGTDDHEQIIDALDRVSGGRVYLTDTVASGVPYTIGEPITLASRKGLIGVGAGDGFGGTVLRAKNGLNADVIQSAGTAKADWWHYGILSGLRIDGNKANNTSGYGANLGQIGETARVERVQFYQCKSGGLKLEGESTPSSIIDVSCMKNDGYGIELVNFTRHATLINPSGDANASGLIRVHCGVTGAVASVVIVNPKAERTTFTSTHDPVILIDEMPGPVTILGGTIDGGATATGTAAIKRSGALFSDVNLIGLRVINYTNQFQDTSSTRTIALTPATSSQTITGFAGSLRTNIFSDKVVRAYSGLAGQVSIGNTSTSPEILFGSSGDTNLARPSADLLQTSDRFKALDGITTKTKAGTPTDADFAQPPESGTIVIDTSTSKIWVRVGSTWKATAALT